jgi:hypothetical protein
MKTRTLLLALPLLAALSCKDNRASVQIQAICSPPTDCKFTAGGCAFNYIGFTEFDAEVAERFWLFLQVENQLPENAKPEQGKLNTNDAHFTEAVIEYDGIPLPRAAYKLPNFDLPANTKSVISVDVIPADPTGATTALLGLATAGGVDRDLVAKLRLRGYYDDGGSFETGEFPIGVRVCSGCLPADKCGTTASCPHEPTRNLGGFEPLSCNSTAG